MDIYQIKTLKKELEKEVKDLLNNFQKSSECKIDNIWINNHHAQVENGHYQIENEIESIDLKLIIE